MARCTSWRCVSRVYSRPIDVATPHAHYTHRARSRCARSHGAQHVASRCSGPRRTQLYPSQCHGAPAHTARRSWFFDALFERWAIAPLDTIDTVHGKLASITRRVSQLDGLMPNNRATQCVDDLPRCANTIDAATAVPRSNPWARANRVNWSMCGMVRNAR